MSRKKGLIPGLSLNRALGVTQAKQKIAKITGIPTTKQGRQRKLERSLFKSFGCSYLIIALFIIMIATSIVIAKTIKF